MQPVVRRHGGVGREGALLRRAYVEVEVGVAEVAEAGDERAVRSEALAHLPRGGGSRVRTYSDVLL